MITKTEPPRCGCGKLFSEHCNDGTLGWHHFLYSHREYGADCGQCKMAGLLTDGLLQELPR